MADEANLKHWVLTQLPKTWHGQTIETTTGRGIPDVNLCTPIGEVWLEFKARHPKPHLRPEQYSWIMRRTFCGGIAMVLHGTDAGWHLYMPPWTVAARGHEVVITSDPLHSGETIQQLATAIYDIQNGKSNRLARN